VTSRRTWILPMLMGLLVSGVWAWLSLGARDGISGPTAPQILVAALALLLVVTWRTHAWSIRRVTGSSFLGLLSRGSWEGMLVGILMGAAAYAVAALQDGTPVTGFLVVIVAVGWALTGAVVFMVLAAVIGISSRPHTADSEVSS